MRHLRLLLLILIAIAVPFQGAMAVSAAQCMALHQDQHGGDGHDHHKPDADHEKPAGSHCSPCSACCASAAIASAIRLVPDSPGHGLSVVALYLPPSVPPLSGIDRPPRFL